MTRREYRTAAIALWVSSVAAQGNLLGPAAYTVPGPFPTSVYQSYYNDPTATSAEPQPVISDPVTHETYPYWLTNPETIPQLDTGETHPLPPAASSSQLLDLAVQQIVSIANNPAFGDDTCTQCQASLEVAKFLALAAPEEGPNLAVRLCEYFDYADDCEKDYGIYTLGSPITQVVAYADVGGYDGQMICYNFLGLCPSAGTSPLNLTGWFAKPKPDPLPPATQPTGERLKILHMSDLHIDPRYTIGAEANCTAYLCCRPSSYNEYSPNVTTQPAPRYGAYYCDAPYNLILAALQAVPVLTGTQENGFNFTIYTGDLVSHDDEHELSKEYTVYTETVLYDLLKRQINSGPVYAVLGNHDTYNEAQNSPYNIGEELEGQFNWDYDHLAALWELEGWISETTTQQARTHYSAYSVQRSDGLRIITLNTDMCERANYYNYINLASSDNSGMLRFLTDELQDAEDAGDRVWILGHVLSGWSGSNPLENPTNLFYQIVDRFSPHVIAGLFFGHTHEDQLSIFYANNGTVMSAETALATEWICPSVTPLTNLNSGFRVYEVDSGTFDVLDAYTWYADVNSFSELDDQVENGPTYNFEYSTREAYGGSITEWGPNDPLNATWWHLVTEAKGVNLLMCSALFQLFNTYQGKSSVRSPSCTGECASAKVCYMRSGSASIAIQNCPSGYDSVQ
ncbi:sphingomyelin phosphodiesterase [Laetiporus sulphureus 93-53]|uniref:Sphingomyelin phosphodiesterase n=1 Tax=Laetiporus sulphureus 93-53 TaxID=1314785 RepID=A0A165CBI1_9APHY|nr:sphingomyelin phosphodiesterase [Laetiporus sulphureus 93-53]KZT02507.1 sphingomyelin phosphodiesterase [Laetiporus sulphureus 93-53]